MLCQGAGAASFLLPVKELESSKDVLLEIPGSPIETSYNARDMGVSSWGSWFH